MAESYSIETATEMQKTYRTALGNALQQLGAGKTNDALGTLEKGVIDAYAKGIGVASIPNTTYAAQVGGFLMDLRKTIAQLGGRVPLNAKGLEVLTETLIKPIEARILAGYISLIPFAEANLTPQEKEIVTTSLENANTQAKKQIYMQVIEGRIAETLQDPVQLQQQPQQEAAEQPQEQPQEQPEELEERLQEAA